jgi:hypothetical protein
MFVEIHDWEHIANHVVIPECITNHVFPLEFAAKYGFSQIVLPIMFFLQNVLPTMFFFPECAANHAFFPRILKHGWQHILGKINMISSTFWEKTYLAANVCGNT